MPYFPPEMPPAPAAQAVQVAAPLAPALEQPPLLEPSLTVETVISERSQPIPRTLFTPRDTAAVPAEGRGAIAPDPAIAAPLWEGVAPALPLAQVTAAVTADPEGATIRRSLAAPWVSQTIPGDADADTPGDADAAEADNAEADATEAPSPPVDPAAQIYPRAATPEPQWSNGAVIEGGTLLPPAASTTRPPTPLNLTADYQEFEPATQVVTARGNVVLRLGNGILTADRLWANLINRYVVVDGNVVFQRGEQIVEAERGEYNLLQEEGSLFNAQGVLFLPGVGNDFGDVVPNDPTARPTVIEADPITNVRTTGSITFGSGVDPNQANAALPTAGGFVRRIRFAAARLDFDAEGWYAEDIRLTNDPFSPPELEFRGTSARLTRLTEVQDELFVENPRAVFDQSFSVPLLRNTILLSRGGPDSANPLFVTFGFDGEDRDGLFVERSFRVANVGPLELFLTPQLLVQRLATGENTSFADNFGLEADLSGNLGPRTRVEANASFSGLDFDNLENRLRSSVRVQQLVGTHTLNLEYSYRDRLFNGSLGFQDVQSSLGLVLLSPAIPLGNTGIVLTYQGSAQYITADTDRLDLLDDLTPPFRTSLGRFQGSVSLGRSFLLWQGTPLPATRDEGLRFTATPRVPNVVFFVGGRGTYTYYTSDDSQRRLSATVGIVGELGHFSKDFLDSTSFNLSYSRSLIGDEGTSPFLFDRDVDQNVLSGGIIQQIYGPFRVGFQTAINLDTGEVINSDYVLEYNRRTYSIVVRYNPVQSSGFVGFRLNEFDWAGRAPRYGGADIGQVEGGVIR